MQPEPPASEALDAGASAPAVVRVFVEIPKGSRNKYELDEATGRIRLDRYLYSASHYPGDYGFVPGTRAEDGDALDVLVAVSEATFPGCLIDSRVVGAFRLRDRGARDDKILAVPDSDPFFAEIQELDDLPAHQLREIEHFFSTYKQLEGASIEPDGWVDRTVALGIVRDAMQQREG